VAELRVPRQFSTGLELLAKLSPAQREQVLEAIQSEAPQLRTDRWSHHLAERLAGVGLAEASEMTNTLLGICAASLSGGRPLDEFVRQIVGSLEEAHQPPDAEAFRDFLVAVLSMPTLVVTAKAIDVLTSHQRIYLSGRIFTDIRPVFGVDLSTGPLAAVIVHTLRVSVRDGQQYTDVYVAMDSADIQNLRGVLDRASEKELRLIEDIRKQGLNYLPMSNDRREVT
jgi:hypothetical protein